MNELLIEVQLHTTSALHVGSGVAGDVTDSLLRRDAQGALMIPGAAVAGALRALATRLAPRLMAHDGVCQAIRDDGTFRADQACNCTVCRLFGDVNPQPEGDGDASRLWVYDAEIDRSTTPTTAIRDGVGIDRATRTASRQGAVKFDMEVLPAGTALVVRMRLTPAATNEMQGANEALLALTLAEWEEGRGALGGRVARGLGGFTVAGITWSARDLTSHGALMDFLRRDDSEFFSGFVPSTTHAQRKQTAKGQCSIRAYPDDNRAGNLTQYAVARSWITAELTLHFPGPMLINDTAMAQRSGFDHAPMAATSSPQSGWILPGSSLRGVLRSQAERIARTLATHAAVQQDDARAYFLEHNPAGDPTVGDGEAALANSDALLTEAGVDGTVRVKPMHVDLADRLFGSTRLGSRFIVEDGALAPDAPKPALKAMDFLAIDRFTGGGRDSAKFDAVALWRPTFKVRLRLENPEAWELGWLLLTLRDLHDGLTTVGFGRAKGFGEVKIQQVDVALGWLHENDLPSVPKLWTWPHAPQSSSDSIWQTHTLIWPASHNDSWKHLGNHWITQFNTKVNNFRRAKWPAGVPVQCEDSYFLDDGMMAKLYPVTPLSGGDK